MTPDTVLYFGKSTITLIMYLSMPIIGAVTAVGLIIALLQTLIQLQEQTLGFAAKLITVIVVILMSGAWMTNEMMQFQEQVFLRIGE